MARFNQENDRKDGTSSLREMLKSAELGEEQPVAIKARANQAVPYGSESGGLPTGWSGETDWWRDRFEPKRLEIDLHHRPPVKVDVSRQRVVIIVLLSAIGICVVSAAVILGMIFGFDRRASPVLEAKAHEHQVRRVPTQSVALDRAANPTEREEQSQGGPSRGADPLVVPNALSFVPATTPAFETPPPPATGIGAGEQVITPPPTAPAPRLVDPSTVPAPGTGQPALALKAPPPDTAKPSERPYEKEADEDLARKHLARGEQLFSDGSVAAARLFFRRAADEGSPEAALALGATYDPNYFEDLRVLGMQAEPEQARFWYGKALDLGSKDAHDRLDALKGR